MSRKRNPICVQTKVATKCGDSLGLGWVSSRDEVRARAAVCALGSLVGALQEEACHASRFASVPSCWLTSLASVLAGRLNSESVAWMEPLNWRKHFCLGLCCVLVLVCDSWGWYDSTKWFTGDVSVAAVGNERLSKVLCLIQALRYSSHSSSASSWGQSVLGLNSSLLQGSPPENLGVLGPGASLAWQISSQGVHVGKWVFQNSRASPAFPAQLWELGLAELGCSCVWVRRKGCVRWDWRRTRDAWVQRHPREDPSGLVLPAQPAWDACTPGYTQVFWAMHSLTALFWHMEAGGREHTRGRFSLAASWLMLLSWLQQTNRLHKGVKLMLNKLIPHAKKFYPCISSTVEKSLGKHSLQRVALWFWDEASNWKALGCL